MQITYDDNDGNEVELRGGGGGEGGVAVLKIKIHLPEHTMMSVQLGETFSGFKIQRPVQWVLRTQHPLLFKYNDYELPKIFVPH